MYHPTLTEEVAYALFRSAIVEGSADAWEMIYQQFGGMLISWARSACLRSECSESPEDIAAQAFGRAWAALTATDIGQFPTLSSLLGYLRQCVKAAVIDAQRTTACRERLVQLLPRPQGTSIEQQVMAHTLNGELWQLLNSFGLSEQEWLVVYTSFVLGMPPRQIWEHYPDRFAAVQEIYGVKRNLLTRLARCDRLRQIYYDLRSVED